MVKWCSYGVPLDRIVAYTYDAAIHCVDCTVKQYGSGAFDDAHDVNGIEYGVQDESGNIIGPEFSNTQGGRTVESCDDCHAVICTLCGDTTHDRAQRDECWNCHTQWESGE